MANTSAAALFFAAMQTRMMFFQTACSASVRDCSSISRDSSSPASHPSIPMSWHAFAAVALLITALPCL
jgi:hypothetical protein